MTQLADGPLPVDMSPAEFQHRIDRMMGIAHPSEVIAANGNSSRPKPPLSTRGYVEDAAFDSLLADLLETVREVAWPTSVQTYQLMRHDAKLAAILDGYSLQIERATWQLDGTGCRPEVVQLVADDLDLPVKGEDKPGAARTRGVSWPDHLQAALTMLPFGHAGFELQAEMVDRRARLVGLWDRPQHTIEQIHVEPKTGAFNGISQELALGPFDKAEIGPERLVWYAHRREGAQWFGRSLIRPAYAPWLFKREMMRVLATSSRRFGMGVPTVRWAEAANPTPEQVTKAQQLASAARVGDTSGASLPPGAWLELVGLSGGSPDTMGFVKWLDQQMATMALMQHLDLGQTQSGSRALGESFIASWLLALETIANEVASATTRQVAARIVEWNWGMDEPVPRVIVSGIGSRREVTAESLKLLLDSGALAADPGLEEWVRREFRLPARATPRPARVQAPGRPDRQPTQEVAAAAAQPKAPPPPPGFQPAPTPAADGPEPAGQVRYEQPALPGVVVAQTEGEPETTAQEQQAEDEMRQVDQDQAAALAALLAAWPLLAAPLVPPLVQAATEAAAAGTMATVAGLTVPADVTAQIAQRVGRELRSLAGLSARRVHEAITAQGVQLDLPQVDTGRLDTLGEATAELIVGGYRSSAARAAANTTSPDVDPQQVGDAVRGAAQELTRTATSQRRGQSRGFVAGELATALHTATHLGRAAVFRALEVLGVPVTWIADERNDRNTCGPCREVNRTRYDSLRAALADYPSGTYRGCLGRQRCRGQIRARIRRSDVDAANPNWPDQPRWPEQSPGGRGGQWRERAGGAGAGGLTPTARQTTYEVPRRPDWRNPDAKPAPDVRRNLTVEGRVTSRNAGVLTITGPDDQPVRVFEPRLGGGVPLGATVRLQTVNREGNASGVHTVRNDLPVEVLEQPPPRQLDTPTDPTPVDELPSLSDMVQTLEAVHLADVEGDEEFDFDVVDEVTSGIESLLRGRFGGLDVDQVETEYEHGELRAKAQIFASGGVQAGEVARSFYRDESGTLVARHESLKIEPEYQGGGFAREFNDRLMSWYTIAGERVAVSLTANIDVGGYAWARDDYEFADAEGFQQVMERLLEVVGDYEDRDDPELRSQVESAWQMLEQAGVDRFDPSSRDIDPDHSTDRQLQPWHISELGRPEGGGRGVNWIGKETLLGSEWEGVKWQ